MKYFDFHEDLLFVVVVKQENMSVQYFDERHLIIFALYY